MVITAKIKEWSRSDPGIQTDPRRSTMQHGPVGQGYRVCQLQRRGIKLYTSKNEDIKAAVIERFNRTLKEKCIAILRQKTHMHIHRRCAGSHICIQSQSSSIDSNGSCRHHSQQGGCDSCSTVSDSKETIKLEFKNRQQCPHDHTKQTVTERTYQQLVQRNISCIRSNSYLTDHVQVERFGP